jgi:hypothetical protein
MKPLNYIILSVFSTLVVLSGFAESQFDQGLKAANQKKYKEAIYLFEEVIEHEKSNTSAYFNLGNCYFENKEYGKAILAYERVLKYSPRDAEAPSNLELCYKKLGNDQQWFPHTNGIQRMIYGIGSNTWAILAIVVSVFMGLSIFLLLKLKNSSWKRLHLLLLTGETVLLIGFVISAKSAENHLDSNKFAIVTQKTIPTYMNEQGERSSVLLQEGTKVELLNSSKQMVEVMLPDSKSVLIAIEDVEVI